MEYVLRYPQQFKECGDNGMDEDQDWIDSDYREVVVT